MPDVLSAIETALKKVSGETQKPLCVQLQEMSVTRPVSYQTVTVTPPTLPALFASKCPKELRAELAELWRLNQDAVDQCEGPFHHTAVVGEIERQRRRFLEDPKGSAPPKTHAEVAWEFLERRRGIMSAFACQYGERYVAAYQEAYRILLDATEEEIEAVHTQETALAKRYGLDPAWLPGFVLTSLLRAFFNSQSEEKNFLREVAEFRAWRAIPDNRPVIAFYPRPSILKLLGVELPPKTETQSPVK